MKKILSAIAGLLLVASSASAFTASTYTKDIIPTNDATAAWKSFKWSWSGVDEIKVSVNLDETIDGFVSLRLASPKKGDIAKQFVLTNLGTTNAWIQFNGTNLPPNDTYWAQFMLEKTNAATASQFKTLANGKISVVYSIWQSTNWSSSTNAIV